MVELFQLVILVCHGDGYPNKHLRVLGSRNLESLVHLLKSGEKKVAVSCNGGGSTYAV
jgi:hypothetical protein